MRSSSSPQQVTKTSTVGAVVANQSKLRPVSLLENEESPEGLHEDGDSHNDFDGDEDPGKREVRVELALGRDDEGDTHAEICPVEDECCHSQEGSQVV